MFSNRLHVFPVVLALHLPLTFIITYAMAVHYEHVEPVFPYFSDTGAVAPESSVFAQLINVYAILVAWCIYLRYGQVRLFYHQVLNQEQVEPNSAQWRTVRRIQLLNKACLVLGIMLASGLSVVANFQEGTIKEIHITGAVVTFSAATIYGWMQSFLSHHIASLSGSKSWCSVIRLALTATYTVACLILLIATKLSLDKFPFSMRMVKKWTPSQPGYTEHLWATFAELVLAVVSSAFFLTFAEDLKNVEMKLHFVPACLSEENGSSNSSISSVPTSGEEEDSIALEAVDRTALVPVNASGAPEAGKTFTPNKQDYGTLE